MEIYNESVNDLLDINKNNLQVREDKNKEIHKMPMQTTSISMRMIKPHLNELSISTTHRNQRNIYNKIQRINLASVYLLIYFYSEV